MPIQDKTINRFMQRNPDPKSGLHRKGARFRAPLQFNQMRPLVQSLETVLHGMRVLCSKIAEVPETIHIFGSKDRKTSQIPTRFGHDLVVSKTSIFLPPLFPRMREAENWQMRTDHTVQRNRRHQTGTRAAFGAVLFGKLRFADVKIALSAGDQALSRAAAL